MDRNRNSGRVSGTDKQVKKLGTASKTGGKGKEVKQLTYESKNEVSHSFLFLE